MSTFYKPFSDTIKKVPVILYPMMGTEDVFDRTKHWVIQDQVQRLLEKHPTLQECTFQIIILWKDAVVMTDIWLFRQLESEDAGFTIDCKTFKGFKEITGNGITASDGLIMLGRETELEEEIRKSGQPLIEKYVFGKRPDLPGELNPTEPFYI